MQALKELLISATPEDSLAAFGEVIDATAFDHYSVLAGNLTNLGSPLTGGAISQIAHVSSCPSDWLDYLVSADAFQDDYDIQCMLTGQLAPFVSGHNILSLMPPLNGAQKKLLARKAEFGFAANLIVPLPRTPIQRPAYEAVMLMSKLDEPGFRNALEAHHDYLVAACHLLRRALSRDALALYGEIKGGALHRRQSKARAEPPASLLTRRQRAVLKGISAGGRPEDVAERLKISRSTVDFHLRAARDALGASTLHEAVAKAIRLKLI